MLPGSMHSSCKIVWHDSCFAAIRKFTSCAANNQQQKTTYSHLFAPETEKAIIDRIVRVDQAGEFGAARIYDGQLAIMKNTKEGRLIEHMAEQEREHQNMFNKLMTHYRVRPTVMAPVWHVAGFILGAGSALCGKEVAMAVTVAVETVISDHYNEQLRELHEQGLTTGDYEQLRKVIKKFRDDEIEHHNIGIENKAEQAPLYAVLLEVVKVATKSAISLSSRI